MYIPQCPWQVLYYGVYAKKYLYMKNYKINPAALLTSVNDFFIKDGFKVIKISMPQAVTMKSRFEQSLYSSFEQALAANGLSGSEALKEEEFFNGYIAVWKGGWLKAYYLCGSLSIASDQRDWISAGRDYKEALQKGELLKESVTWKKGDAFFVGAFCEIAYICGYYANEFLQKAEIGNRLRDAILCHDGIIALEDEEKEKFLAFVRSFTNLHCPLLTAV